MISTGNWRTDQYQPHYIPGLSAFHNVAGYVDPGTMNPKDRIPKGKAPAKPTATQSRRARRKAAALRNA